MRPLLQEYGLVIIALMCTVGFFAVYTDMFKGFVFIYNTHELYTPYRAELDSEVVGTDGGIYDSIHGIHNTNAKVKVPHFEVGLNGDLNTVIPVLDVSQSSIDVNEGIFDLVTDGGIRVRYYDTESASWNTENISLDNITIVEYRPQRELSSIKNGVFMSYKTEKVDAYDEFGNRIRLDDGTYLQTDSLVYDKYLWSPDVDNLDIEAKAGFTGWFDIRQFRLNQDLPCKYKVIYRYSDGAVKCEYTEIFRNDVRTESQIVFGRDE